MRGAVLVGLFILSLYAVRLVDLQAIQSDALAAKAESSRTVKIPVPADRGVIYDTHGVPLAQTLPARDITADPTEIKDPDTYAAQLSPLLGLTPERIAASLQRRKLPDGRDSKFAYVAKSVRLEVWKQIQDLGLPGLFDVPASLRSYPAGPLAANVIGFMGENS